MVNPYHHLNRRFAFKTSSQQQQQQQQLLLLLLLLEIWTTNLKQRAVVV